MNRKGRLRARRTFPPRTFRHTGDDCLTYIVLGVASVLAVVGGLTILL